VPAAPVLTRSEMISHPQIEAVGIHYENDHPVAGRLRQARNAARFSATTPEHRRGAPALGEHTDEVLAEAGLAPDEIAALRAAKVVGA
jgi:crotonobetainyl-CoA:carnitine CoA-transferase CaiB-like acyl-CoA transferase